VKDWEPNLRVQGHGEARWVPGRPVLTIVPACTTQTGPSSFASGSGGFFLNGAAAIDSLKLLFMKSASILLPLLAAIGWRVSAHAQTGTWKSEALARATQMIAVTTSDWNALAGRLRRYERAAEHEKWRPVGAPTPIVVYERLINRRMLPRLLNASGR
jgi:hypothetical protein